MLMGYGQDAMVELHGDRMIDNTPPTIQEAYERPEQMLKPVFYEVAAELRKARATHAPMNSHHEGYAVILEELDELWEVCKTNTHKFVTDIDSGRFRPATHEEQAAMTKRKREAMRKEAIQVAAMAIRFVQDICDK